MTSSSNNNETPNGDNNNNENGNNNNNENEPSPSSSRGVDMTGGDITGGQPERLPEIRREGIPLHNFIMQQEAETRKTAIDPKNGWMIRFC